LLNLKLLYPVYQLISQLNSGRNKITSMEKFWLLMAFCFYPVVLLFYLHGIWGGFDYLDRAVQS
jgi:hypothetical protein